MKLKEFVMKNCRSYHISFKNIRNKNRYYIIRRHPPGAGFFSNFVYVFSHISYARAHGYIPVVDMKNYNTLYNVEEPICGTENAWEYYFAQPDHASLDLAYHSNNYIMSDYSLHREYVPYIETGDGYELNKDLLSVASRIIRQDMQLRTELKAEIDDIVSREFAGKTVLAVHYRGTDKHKKNEGHYIAPELQKYIDETQRMVAENKIDRIFLCTDEKETIDIFSEKFPGMVFWNEAYRAEKDATEGIHLDGKGQREHHKYLLGKEVILDAYLLSNADYLIHAHSNVTNAAIMLNDNSYKKRVLIKLG